VCVCVCVREYERESECDCYFIVLYGCVLCDWVCLVNLLLLVREMSMADLRAYDLCSVVWYGPQDLLVFVSE